MSSNIKTAYGTQGVAITITPGALGNGSARQSASVDNTTNLYLDALVTVTIKTPSSGIAAPKVVNVYVAGSIDGTTWPGGGSGNNDGVTGSDATITLESPTNLTLLGVVNVPTASQTVVSEPMSVSQALNGAPLAGLPPKWSIILDNESGAALVTGSTAAYTGVYATVG
jgi:hypothetical protein